MEEETLIMSKINAMLDEKFLGLERSVTVRRFPDGSFRTWITSPDSSFLARLIGRQGMMADRFKKAFTEWAESCNMKTMVWIERQPMQNYE